MVTVGDMVQIQNWASKMLNLSMLEGIELSAKQVTKKLMKSKNATRNLPSAN
jgi:hypothetical protein